MNVLIIEDESAAARGLTNALHELNSGITVLNVIDSVAQSIDWIKSHDQPDLIFMDIQLKDGICFDIFRKVDVYTPIVFCTAYDSYAIEAFKVNSIDYLLKPLDTLQLKQSLEKFHKIKSGFRGSDSFFYDQLAEMIKKSQSQSKKRYLVKAGKKFYHVDVMDISYVYTENKIVYLVTHDHRKFQLDHTMDEMELQLPDQEFYRISRQYLISIKSIVNVENDYGKLMVNLNGKVGTSVGVSRNRADGFKIWLDN